MAEKRVKTGGRQKGSKNKASAALEAKIAESGLTPLEFMLDVLRDETRPEIDRMDAAKAAAPYVHPKLASTVVTGKDGGPIQVDRVVVQIVDGAKP